MHSATRDQVVNVNMSKKNESNIDHFKDAIETRAVSIPQWDYFGRRFLTQFLEQPSKRGD